MTSARETRLKRVRIRSWRRGIREMDLVLGGWADQSLAALEDADLDLFEELLEENDHDIHAWVTGRVAPPNRFQTLIDAVKNHLIRKLPH